MCGHALPFRRAIEVTLSEPVTLRPRLQHFLRAIVSDDGDGMPEVRLTGPQGSGILTSMIKANALLIIPEGQHETPAGSVAVALRLDDPVYEARPGF
jgi:molybdopterin molybdotransferase